MTNSTGPANGGWIVVREEFDSERKGREIVIGTHDSNKSNCWLYVGVGKEAVAQDIFLSIYWNMEIGYSVKPPVSWKIDDGPWRRRRGWMLSVDHKWTYMPESEVMDMVMALSSATKLSVRVYPFGKNPIETDFHVMGFETMVVPVIEAMNDAINERGEWWQKMNNRLYNRFTV